MIILTIVRHGESTDNLKSCWAGSSDAPLSGHGMNQAAALGKSLSTYPITHIFASNLLRATWTAQQIHRQQQTPSETKPPLQLSPLLQEQHFGKAERQPWTSEEGGKAGKGFFRRPGREFRFPEGESLNDVRVRAEEAMAKFIEPILQSSRNVPLSRAPKVFIVAHGIFNAELLGALLARREPGDDFQSWKSGGMTNTGWTRVEVGVGGDPNPSSVPGGKPALKPETEVAKHLPYLNVKILCTNVATHLEGLKRQGGGIGSSAYDSNQRGLKEFFGGAGAG